MQTAIDTSYQAPKFSVAEYHELWEKGQLPEHVELLNGEIRKMAPIDPGHQGITGLLTVLLGRVLDTDQLSYQLQCPVKLNDFSEPEPDVSIFNKTAETLYGQTPEAADALLLIEVSESTLAFDLGPKSVWYGKSGIPDYCVFDMPNAKVHHFTSPSNQGYQHCRVLTVEDKAAIITVSGLELPLKFFFERVS